VIRSWYSKPHAAVDGVRGMSGERCRKAVVVVLEAPRRERELRVVVLEAPRSC
jgi:hypothetical protein